MWNALQNLTEKRQKNKKCIKTIQKKNEFCISRQLCEKNKSGKTNISSDKEIIDEDKLHRKISFRELSAGVRQQKT